VNLTSLRYSQAWQGSSPSLWSHLAFCESLAPLRIGN